MQIKYQSTVSGQLSILTGIICEDQSNSTTQKKEDKKKKYPCKIQFIPLLNQNFR